MSHAITTLVDNRDVREMTAHDYVVGYIVKALHDAGLVEDSPLEKPDKQ